MFPENFTRKTVRTGETEINTVSGGEGKPLLLLHGYPQTHLMWHAVAAELSSRFFLVCPDLRGYGDSSKPPGEKDHSNYSKRAMANDMVEVMDAFGFKRFLAAGHDRGARVLHRMCLDHPARVEKACVMDIAPTHHMFSSADKDFATGYYHWFFLIQPDGLPEKMIGADPEYYLREKLKRWSAPGARFHPDAAREYVRCFGDPAAIHGSCEDYRAAASIDMVHDEEDMDRKIECPLLALWGERGFIHRTYDVLDSWKKRARDVCGEPLDCGHFLPEEKPEETSARMLSFFS